ncbi:hypothetical protein ACNSPG_03935 [Brucella pituitosa]|uniref:hypothetical protein n=1 Tax=Brucella pituitosa TaxID=571256 RepID=UPI003C7317FE
MRADIIRSIIATKDPIETSLSKLLATFAALNTSDGINFGLDTKIPDTDDSFSEVITRIQLLISNIIGLEKVKQPELVPYKQINNMLIWCRNIKINLDNINECLLKFVGEGSVINSLELDSLSFISEDGSSVSILEPSTKLRQAVEEILWLLCFLTPSVRSKGSIDFTLTSEALLEVYSNLQTGYKDLREGLSSVENSAAQVEKDIESITQESEEIKRLKSEVSNERKTASEYLAEITQNRSAIKEIHDDAVTLKSAVSEYRSEFDAFQKNLEQRNRAFEIGKSRLKELTESFEARENRIADIERQAEDMLSSSTVAGLASHFLKLRTELTQELSDTQETFRKGIIFLAASAIPLLLFVLHPILSPLYAWLLSENVEKIVRGFTSASQDKWGYLGQTIGRITLLLPAVWFVSFTAIRYSSLFRLREHYAYKYSMAAAVEGFKHQAPEYQEEIAALVLEQLAFNPVDKLVPSKEIKEGKIPNIGRFLYEKIIENTKKDPEIKDD